MFRINHKVNTSENYELDGKENFTQSLLPNKYNYRKMAESAMLKVSKETVNKLSTKIKKTLKKKETIELLWDKKTDAVAIVIARKKKPIKTIQVWEIVEEETQPLNEVKEVKNEEN